MCYSTVHNIQTLLSFDFDCKIKCELYVIQLVKLAIVPCWNRTSLRTNTANYWQQM